MSSDRETETGLAGRAKGSALPPLAQEDDTDYEHRHFVNLLAMAFLLAIAAALIWTVQAIDENEKLQRCLNAGRRDCVKIDAPTNIGVRVPVR
jgi:hypothetical protein